MVIAIDSRNLSKHVWGVIILLLWIFPEYDEKISPEISNMWPRFSIFVGIAIYSWNFLNDVVGARSQWTRKYWYTLLHFFFWIFRNMIKKLAHTCWKYYGKNCRKIFHHEIKYWHVVETCCDELDVSSRRKLWLTVYRLRSSSVRIYVMLYFVTVLVCSFGPGSPRRDSINNT